MHRWNSKTDIQKSAGVTLPTSLFLLIILIPITAYAVTLNNPAGGFLPTNPNGGGRPILDDQGRLKGGSHKFFGIRDIHPVSKRRNVPHRGLDLQTGSGTVITLPEGATIIPDASGKILRGNATSGYGYWVEVSYGNGITERYAHLQDFNAATGQVITGNTGGSTGAHLHYEIRIDGVPVDPQLAWGRDLSGANTRQLLIDDANDKLNGQAGQADPTARQEGIAIGGEGAPTTMQRRPAGAPEEEGVIYIDDPRAADFRAQVYRARPTREDDIGDLEGPADLVTIGQGGGEPNSGCAVDTWTAMVNRATMEARRETTINQRYILKADSVLEYGCFLDRSDILALHAGPLFSETRYWENREVTLPGAPNVPPGERKITLSKVMPEGQLGLSLFAVVTDVLIDKYLSVNFGHQYLGGTMRERLSGNNCVIMARAWENAKCLNFTDEPFFPRFTDLITGEDPRIYPEPDFGSSCRPENSEITNGMLTQAALPDMLQEDYAIPSRGLQVSDTVFYRYMTRDSCDITLFSGVEIIRPQEIGLNRSDVRYPDALCPNSACAYKGRISEKEGQPPGPGRCVPVD